MIKDDFATRRHVRIVESSDFELRLDPRHYRKILVESNFRFSVSDVYRHQKSDKKSIPLLLKLSEVQNFFGDIEVLLLPKDDE